jgi:hypothetical protein
MPSELSNKPLGVSVSRPRLQPLHSETLRQRLLAGGLTQFSKNHQNMEVMDLCQLRLATELSSSHGPDGARVSKQVEACMFI